MRDLIHLVISHTRPGLKYFAYIDISHIRDAVGISTLAHGAFFTLDINFRGPLYMEVLCIKSRSMQNLSTANLIQTILELLETIALAGIKN